MPRLTLPRTFLPQPLHLPSPSAAFVSHLRKPRRRQGRGGPGGVKRRGAAGRGRAPPTLLFPGRAARASPGGDGSETVASWPTVPRKGEVRPPGSGPDALRDPQLVDAPARGARDRQPALRTHPQGLPPKARPLGAAASPRTRFTDELEATCLQEADPA